jgi:hypothetical protein
MSNPVVSEQDVLDFFKFDGPILDSNCSSIPQPSLNAAFGEIDGKVLGDQLRGYHPLAGLGNKVKLEIKPLSGNPAKRCLQATDCSGSWSHRAKTMFQKIEWIPSPSGFKFMIPQMLNPAVHKVGEWTLHYARIEGGPNPYDPTPTDANMAANDPRTRKVLLIWTIPGLNEYVITCWRWG